MSTSTEARPGAGSAAEVTSATAVEPRDAAGADLGQLDDQLLDLLRARVAAGMTDAAGLRPGREAAILRRLVGQRQGGQRQGGLPPSAIIAIWREIFAASLAQRQTALVAVCDPAMDGRFQAAAREYLGALTPIRVYRGPAQAIGEVVDGRASAAVLPLPGEAPADGSSGPGWWPGLLQQNTKGRIHVVARLPVWTARPEGAPAVQAVIIANHPADPSGEDIGLLALETDPRVSLGTLSQAVTAAGFTPLSALVNRPAGVPIAQFLLEVEGFVAADDPRLARITGLQAPALVVGAYAVAISEEFLA